MTLSDYVTLGRSGLRVSRFCLGTMTFGEDWGLRAATTLPRSRWHGCQGRAGVASTIIGARRLDQLDQNLAALDVRLADERVRRSTRPPSRLNFPANFPKFAVMFMHGGATVNGEPSAVWALAPRKDAERF